MTKRGRRLRLTPFLLEAASGFEPLNRGFADLCLTTWLRRRNEFYLSQEFIFILFIVTVVNEEKLSQEIAPLICSLYLSPGLPISNFSIAATTSATDISAMHLALMEHLGV